MRHLPALTAAGFLLCLAGCQIDQAEEAHNPWPDEVFVRFLADAHVQNALLRQQSLFAYHFEQDSADLNDLGRHDLQVLAAHYRANPGRLNIPRGDLDVALYQARVRGVLKALADAEVPTGRMVIVDDLPGGEGMSSERVVQALTREAEAREEPAGMAGFIVTGSGGGQ